MTPRPALDAPHALTGGAWVTDGRGVLNLALSPTQRKRADQLIVATVHQGADATADMLRHFPHDAWPALIAYLSRVAAQARDLNVDPTAWQHGQPDRFTPAQRKEAHRLYLQGVRTIEVVLGKREYDRVWRRQNRKGKAKG